MMLARNLEPEVQLAVRISYGPEPIWRAMCDLTKTGRGFAVRDVTIRVGAGDYAVRDYLRRLLCGGYVHEIGVSDLKVQLYTVSRLECVAPRLLANGRRCTRSMIADHLWRTLKMTKGEAMTVNRLAVMASTDDITIPEATALKYIQVLEQGGYVRRVGKKNGPSTQYRMIPGTYTGPAPPAMHRATFIYDANKRCVMGDPVASREVKL